MRRVLSKNFFNRDTREVAKDLLGKFLVRRRGNKEIVLMITEVEAYDGYEDKASHAHNGETARNAPMFGDAGFWYVYLCYGMHEMLNIVTGPKDYPAAVLVRGTKEYSGPGKLTKALYIGRGLNNKKACKETGLWIEDRGVHIHLKDIRKTTRIGVSYAGPLWAGKQYRFILKAPVVSKYE